MAQTITGKCTFTTNSATVQGNADVGWNSLNFPDPTSRKVTIKPRNTNAVYQVATVNYATRQCTLTAPYAGTTVADGDYEVSWDFTSRGYRRIGLNDQDFAVYVTEAIDQINEEVETFVAPSVGPAGPRGLPGDAEVYSAGTTYAIDNQVYFGTDIYYSLQNDNVGHTPSSNPDWWQKVALGVAATYLEQDSLTIESTAVAYASDGTMYAATRRGVYRSTDNGQNWSLEDVLHEANGAASGTLWGNTSIRAFLLFMDSADCLYVSFLGGSSNLTADESGLFRRATTPDGSGHYWSKVLTLDAGKCVYDIGEDPAGRDDGTPKRYMYASIYGTGGSAIYRSSTGTTWSSLTLPAISPARAHTHGVAVSANGDVYLCLSEPANSDLSFSSGNPIVLKSVDDGANWTTEVSFNTTTYPEWAGGTDSHLPFHGFARVYCGDTFRLYSVEHQRFTWFIRESGGTFTNVLKIASSPKVWQDDGTYDSDLYLDHAYTNPVDFIANPESGIIYAAMRGNACLYASSDNGVTWKLVWEGDDNYVVNAGYQAMSNFYGNQACISANYAQRTSSPFFETTQWEPTLRITETTAPGFITSRMAINPVPKGQAHDHIQGAGAPITELALSLSDITTGNATTGQHGLLPKLGGGTTNFLRADGSWAAPASGGSTPSGAAGSIQFSGGSTLASDASNLFWNNTIKGLGIGTNAPISRLDIKNVAGVSSGGVTFSISNGSTAMTTSSDVTLNAGDILTRDSNPAEYFVIAETATGTSFTVTSKAVGSYPDELYTVYKPTMLIKNNDGTSAFAISNKSGHVYIGSSGNTSRLHDSKLSIVAASTALFKAINTSNTSSSAGGAGLQAFHDSGAALQTGHRAGFLIFGGSYDTSGNLANAASIDVLAASNWTASNAEANLALRTTPNGSLSRRDSVIIMGSGMLRTLYGIEEKTAYITNSTYTITTGDHNLLINNGSGATITFPAPSADNIGRIIQLRSITSTTHSLASTGNAFWAAGSAVENSGNFSWASGSGSTRWVVAQTGASTYHWVQIT